MRTSNFDRERANSCSTNSSGGSTGVSAGVSAKKSRPHSGCDIVKAGYLHIKRPPTNGAVKLRIKTWQKRYLVLRDQSYDRGTARLDIFATESDWQDSDEASPDCYSIDLHTVSHVDVYTESKSYPNAFTITRTGRGPLVLGADSDFEAKKWIVAIQLLTEKLKGDQTTSGSQLVPARPDQARRPSCPSRLTHWNSAGQLHTSDLVNNNELSGKATLHQGRAKSSTQSNVRVLKIPASINTCRDCLVRVQNTEAAKRNNLSGEYNMIVQDYDVILRRPDQTTDVIKWSLGNIRKFKSEDLSDGWNLVTLDANVRCGSQSGIFQFRTAFGRKLIQRVKEALKQHASGNKDSEKDLDKLRNKNLIKAPSTPNLINRASPPKIVPKSQKAAVRERTHSSSEEGSKPTSYLQLLPEEQPEPDDDAGDYVDDQLIQETTVQPASYQITGNSTKCSKRPPSGLPPVPPPPSISAAAVSSPQQSSSSSSSSSSLPAGDDEPPELPPRRPSCAAPPPPPRPQHTLSTNSLPVANVR